jgi:sterol 24-C-methyltransferase
MGGSVNRVSAIGASEAIQREKVASIFTDYSHLFDDAKGGSVDARNENYEFMVNNFYNMVTDIYEFGWGESFHFAPRHKWESFQASIARHEMYLAHKLEMNPGKAYLDLGCGVGGPGRTMSRFSGATVVGLNNNEYQIKRCKALTKTQGLSHLNNYFKGDWMSIPMKDNTFDGAFHVEAIEHSPDRVGAFREILRVIKPGGLFSGYDWCITDKCDVNNADHVRIKKGIEFGNGVADLKKPGEVLDNLREAGFEVIEARDMALFDPQYEIGWYDSLEGRYLSFGNFKHTPLGRYFTNKMVWFLETVRVAPKGTLDIHNMLMKVAVELVEGGKQGIFTPMYYYLCRKPL